MSWTVDALLGGSARAFRDSELSAIAKLPLPGRVAITTLGLAGDQQADRVHHGGPDMAVHVYPLDHHDFWRGELGAVDLLADPGAFGSNLAIRDMTEGDLAIGDRFRLGSALLEVSRPRQPCWKIEHRFGARGMVKTILKTGRCGWYFRVLEEGAAEAGDTLELVEQASNGWTVARTFAALFTPGFPGREQALRELVELPSLAQGLRASLSAR
ncbi:MAG: MOSC domain-containing protein [Alteraurantiacibacter sp.]